MSELNLPELPENYRWRVQKNDNDPSRDAVNLFLEKLVQHWWGDTWRPIHSNYVAKVLGHETLVERVEKRAIDMYNTEFDRTESGRIAGIYGNNQHRKL